MNGTAAAVAAAVVLGLASTCGASATLIGATATPCTDPAADIGPGLHTTHADWSTEQIRNAATIITVGATLDIPARGHTIAVATAMQESSLINTPTGDRDSIGLFQQRPSQAWGTPAQLIDPVYAAGMFYQALTDIPGWQTMPLTDAAQAVQRSATPTAYATWEPDATAMIAAIAAHTPTNPTVPDPCAGDCPDNQTVQAGAPAPDCDTEPIDAAPPDFTIPADTPPAVTTAIAWALQQLGTPYAFGGDCTAAQSGNPAHQCDCSSLVLQAYRAAGITLPRTADQQSRTGTPVLTTDQLRPGDLLFVPGADGTAQHPGHVGVYLGDHLILDAPHTGATVHITPITTYWTTTLNARRIASSN